MLSLVPPSRRSARWYCLRRRPLGPARREPWRSCSGKVKSSTCRCGLLLISKSCLLRAGWSGGNPCRIQSPSLPALQIDSHMRFIEGWDTALLSMLRRTEATAGHPRTVLSTYPPGYQVSVGGAAHSLRRLGVCGPCLSSPSFCPRCSAGHGRRCRAACPPAAHGALCGRLGCGRRAAAHSRAQAAGGAGGAHARPVLGGGPTSGPASTSRTTARQRRRCAARCAVHDVAGCAAGAHSVALAALTGAVALPAGAARVAQVLLHRAAAGGGAHPQAGRVPGARRREEAEEVSGAAVVVVGSPAVPLARMLSLGLLAQ